MTEKGFRIFRGAVQMPYRPTDFVSLAQTRDLSEREKSGLRAIERASSPNSIRLGASRSTSASRPQTEAPAPVSSRLITDPAGKSVRLIGPQAMLQAGTQAQP